MVRTTLMRGADEQTGALFSYLSPEAMVPKDHPLRAIRPLVNAALARLPPDFARLYAPTGRVSIAPEKLLRALLLQAFYSVRSERQLMEQLTYNMLFRWFVGLAMDAPVRDVTVFTKSRERLLEGDIARGFLRAVLLDPAVKRLLSIEHFSVDGTLIEAWASMKSFRPKDSGGEPPGPGRNGERDFRGERRSNATHASTTGPDARPYREARGQASKLCHMGHLLMENRSGLVVDTETTHATGTAEREAAEAMAGDVPGCVRADHARLGQGLRRGRARGEAAGDERHAACRPEHHEPRLGHRRPHDAPPRLRPEPAHPQAHRGGLRLD